MYLLTCLFGFYYRFQHCNSTITTGSFVGRGNQYKQLVKVLCCKLPTTDKQLPTFPYMVQGLNRRPQKLEVSMLPLRYINQFLNVDLTILAFTFNNIF